jgi:hypothetical protein
MCAVCKPRQVQFLRGDLYMYSKKERERRRVYETAGQVTTETEVTMTGRKAAGETVSLYDSRAEMFNV